jgi:hypothetical protein
MGSTKKIASLKTSHNTESKKREGLVQEEHRFCMQYVKQIIDLYFLFHLVMLRIAETFRLLFKKSVSRRGELLGLLSCPFPLLVAIPMMLSRRHVSPCIMSI